MAVIGFEGTLSVAGCTSFRNIKFGISATEIDITTNADQGNKVYAKGLIDKSITADLEIGGTGAAAVMTAVEARTPVAVTATMGDVSLSGNFLVFGGDISGSIDDAAWMTITLRPTRAA